MHLSSTASSENPNNCREKINEIRNLNLAITGTGLISCKPRSKLTESFFLILLAREIEPFIWIVFDVVEFFFSAGVADVFPLMPSDGYVTGIEHGKHMTVDYGSGCTYEWHEGLATEPILLGKLADFYQRGINVKQTHGLIT